LHQILGVRGFRGHTISRRKSNLFNPLRRHSPANRNFHWSSVAMSIAESAPFKDFQRHLSLRLAAAGDCAQSGVRRITAGAGIASPHRALDRRVGRPHSVAQPCLA
jgi:hypothetical protein